MSSMYDLPLHYNCKVGYWLAWVGLASPTPITYALAGTEYGATSSFLSTTVQTAIFQAGDGG